MSKAYNKEYRAILRLGAPVLVTQIGVIVVSFADTMMVGAYGTRELAAVAFVNSIYTVVLVMIMGFASGLTPLIGALFTQKRNDDAGQTLRRGLKVNIAVSLVFTAIMTAGYFFLDHLGQPEEIMLFIKEFYLILLFTLIPSAIYSCCQQMANGITDTQMPMWIVLGANVLNIAGNYALIFGHFGMPELGIVGAGLSTLATRVLGTVAIVVVILCSKRYRPYRDALLGRVPHARGERSRKIWDTSFPVMIQSGIECFLWMFGATVCGWFGTLQLASYQIVTTLGQLGFLTYFSFATAIAIRVSNCNGLKDVDGMRRAAVAGLHFNMLLATAASLVFFFLSHPLLRMFTPDEEVIRAGMLLIAPLILYQFADAIQFSFCNAQRGTSHVTPLAWVSFFCYVVVGIPVLYWFSVGMNHGNIGVYYSFSVALFSAAILYYLTFRRTLAKLRIKYA